MAGKDSLQRLVRAARRAREGAYSPYSGVKIGAAVLSSGGSIHTGANVENVSYGLSCCAERTALFSAVAGGDRKIVAIAVVGGSEEFTRPCGACRQVMVEFNPAMTVMMRGVDGFAEDAVAESLLPTHFNPPELSKR